MNAVMLTFNVVAAIVAFLIGYLINQGGTCAVAASREVVSGRPPSLFLGFILAAGAAGLLTLPLAGALGPIGHVGAYGVVAAPLFIGACLVAIGAVLNDACLLGSLWRLGNGELRLLFLPLGLALGFYMAHIFAFEQHPLSVAPVTKPVVLILTFLAVLIASTFALRKTDKHRMAGRMPLALSMALLGFAGSFMFVVRPGWTYADLVKLAVAPSKGVLALGFGVALPALMTIGGALTAALRAKTFALSLPAPMQLARTITGGIFMASGASMIPGGNDSLLLGAIPSGSLSGTIAYLTMNALILAMIAFLGQSSAMGRDFH